MRVDLHVSKPCTLIRGINASAKSIYRTMLLVPVTVGGFV